MFCARLCDFRVPSSSMSARPDSLGLLSSAAAVDDDDDDDELLSISFSFAESTVSSMVASVEKSCDEDALHLLW